MLREGRRGQANAAARRWLPGELAIILPFATMPLPPYIGVLALTFLVVVVFATYVRYSAKLFEPLPVLCIILALWLALGLTNANVTSIEGGLLGLRLSLTFIIGIMLGYAWPRTAVPPFRASWYCIAIFSTLSIFVFLFFPGIEGAISRGHDEYTALFAGQARLQGLWPSPAHASLAAVFLVLSSVRANAMAPSRLVRWAAALVGVYALYLTQIRVGVLACIAGLALLAATSGSVVSRVGRVLALSTATLVIGFGFSEAAWRWIASYPALASLFAAESDSRLLGRIDTWRMGLEMLAASPFVGWGPGSAGSTLGDLFGSGGHVTPHSPYLKYAVEGGLLAIFLFVAIMALLIVAVIRTRDYAKVGVAVLAPLLVTSVTGTVVEAIPVSLVFAVMLGRYAGHRREAAEGLKSLPRQTASELVAKSTRARRRPSNASNGRM